MRARVPVPSNGLRRRHDEMLAWLRKHAPNEGHWVGSQNHGLSGAALVYFADIAVAREFCEAFECSFAQLAYQVITTRKRESS